MKKCYGIFLVGIFAMLSSNASAQAVQCTIVVSENPTPISPYIYGANPEFTSAERLTARRLGGNRLTGYNWENNASNAGSDWNHSSDNYLTWSAGITNENVPGIVATTFHNKASTAGAYSLMTLQMAGYVAKDKNGSVSEAEKAPSPRWATVQYEKGSPFSLSPTTTDTVVYMDEFVNFLVANCGTAATTGIQGYALDNEPALWPTTHPRIHPSKPTCSEIVQRSVALARAVKNVDSTAEIFGPVLYGFSAFNTFQDAPDWSTVKAGKSYAWFIDYYLDTMREAETTYGRRLLDVLDIHWYPEAKGTNRITETNATTAADKAARLQAPRTLWDATYRENSWIGQYFSSRLPLLPKLFSSINQYYPGTKLAITEFTYGGENDITGALALTDVLGIFGKYGVYMAAFWPLNSNTSYIQAAYRLYRNYDGNAGSFGDLSLPAWTSDSVSTSVYASLKSGTNEIHVIAINKNLTASTAATFSFTGISSLTGGAVWILDSTSTTIKNGGDIPTLEGKTFSYMLPAASACHFVLQASSTGVVESEQELQPTRFALRTFPNPFNSHCTIEYTAPSTGASCIEIVDLRGRKIRTYNLSSTTGIVQWDGTSDDKRAVASGVYIILLRGVLPKPVIQRVVLLK